MRDEHRHVRHVLAQLVGPRVGQVVTVPSSYDVGAHDAVASGSQGRCEHIEVSAAPRESVHAYGGPCSVRCTPLSIGDAVGPCLCCSEDEALAGRANDGGYRTTASKTRPSRSSGVGTPVSLANVGAASTVAARPVDVPAGTLPPRKTSGTCRSYR